jgi:ADP-dependent NAD(P)H-hydrate dehydratase
LSTKKPSPLDVAGLRREPLPLDPSDDKSDRGTVLVIGGSRETSGAVILAGLSALRIGAGRLQVMVDSKDAWVLGPSIPEALVGSIHLDEESGAGGGRLMEHIEQAEAILLGPGLADSVVALHLLEKIARHSSSSSIVILDAMAIAAVRELGSKLRSRLEGRWAFTPNRGELQRLMAGVSDEDEYSPAEAARLFVATVSCSGLVANPDGDMWAWRTPVVGLGTSGSGDVLAGLIAGAAARCANAEQAARWGTYLHMVAGLRCSEEVGQIGYLARELIEPIPALLMEAEGGDREPPQRR